MQPVSVRWKFSEYDGMLPEFVEIREDGELVIVVQGGWSAYRVLDAEGRGNLHGLIEALLAANDALGSYWPDLSQFGYTREGDQ